MPTTTQFPILYQRPRALRADAHAKLSLSRTPDYSFAAGVNSVPLLATEMTAACRCYPILFVAADLPLPVALLGLRTDENLLVGQDGSWVEGAYIPAYIRRYPFIFLESEDKSELTLCIDEAAPALVSGGDNLFFADGKPTAMTTQALSFCQDFQSHYNATAEFARALAAADLLVDNRADISLKNGETLSLSGFKVIDEARFNRLPEEEFLRWRARGWLHIVSCHFISIGSWAGLVERLAMRTPAAA
jgi:hypothetical protein